MNALARPCVNLRFTIARHLIIPENLGSVTEIEHLFLLNIYFVDYLLSEEDARVIQLIEVCAIASMTQITLT